MDPDWLLGFPQNHIKNINYLRGCLYSMQYAEVVIYIAFVVILQTVVCVVKVIIFHNGVGRP